MTHPSDIELAAWIDEPGKGGADLAAHLAACANCREIVADIEAARTAIAIDPPLPAEAELAAQRERIAAAIAGAPRSGANVVRRLAWLAPLAAAAAVAAVVLLGRTGTDTPPTGDVASSPIALVTDAREAAELAATGIFPDAVAAPAEAFDEDQLEAALAAAEPLAPPAWIETSMTTETGFAELAAEDQSAILTELASADFDL